MPDSQPQAQINKNLRIGKPEFSIAEFRKGDKLSELIHRVGHDIGNPLTAIISIGSVIQTLSEFELKPGQENKMPFYAESVISEAWRISRINERMVCLMSTRQGAPSPCDVERTITGALMRLKSREKRKFKNVEIEVSSSSSPLEAYVDNNQFSLLATELIANAVEAHERECAKKGLTAEQYKLVIPVKTTKIDDYAQFQLSNPISNRTDRELSELFSPMVTCHPDEKRIGMGLGVCLAIVERFGGEIELSEEEAGDAYRFCTTVRFPTAKAIDNDQ